MFSIRAFAILIAGITSMGLVSCRYSNIYVIRTAYIGRYYIEWCESSSGHFPTPPRHSYWCNLYKKNIIGRYKQVNCHSSNIYSISDTAECSIEFDKYRGKKDIEYKLYVVNVCDSTVFKFNKKGKAKQKE